MKLLDPKNAILHSEINNVSLMNALAVLINFCETRRCPEAADMWRVLYNSLVLHMIPHKRKRSKEIVEITKELMSFYGLKESKDRDKSGWL